MGRIRVESVLGFRVQSPSARTCYLCSLLLKPANSTGLFLLGDRWAPPSTYCCRRRCCLLSRAIQGSDNWGFRALGFGTSTQPPLSPCRCHRSPPLAAAGLSLSCTAPGRKGLGFLEWGGIGDEVAGVGILGWECTEWNPPFCFIHFFFLYLLVPLRVLVSYLNQNIPK